MRIFLDIDPSKGMSVIEQAFAGIRRGLAALAPPRSLAELRLEEDDYQWLSDWACHFTGTELGNWLKSTRTVDDTIDSSRIPRRDVIGLILLLIAAERARRGAQEGAVWSSVRGAFPGVKGAPLFDSSGQPTWEHKDALEHACRRFQLRNVFGQVGTQAWYVSIYLQFGFTRHGLKSLPLWLSGHPVTESIGQLYRGGSPSNSFQELWRTLRAYRQGLIAHNEAKKNLQQSPWILPGWVDEVLTEAKARLNLGTVSEPGAASESDAEGLPFLSDSKLEWIPPAPPRLRISVINLASIDSRPESYEVTINGAVMLKLLKQPDNTYHSLNGSFDISLPVADRLVAALQGPGGEIAHSLEMSVWEPTEDVVAFSLPGGARVDPWMTPMSTTSAYALVTASDLTVTPPPRMRAEVCDGRFLLYHLPSGWDGATAVYLDGHKLWEPASVKAAPSQPEWARISLQIQPIGFHDLGATVRLQIMTPREVELAGLRLDRHPLSFTADDGSYLSDEITISPELLAGAPTITALVSRGAEVRLIRQGVPFAAWVKGVSEFKAGNWVARRPDDPLTAAAAAAGVFKLHVPQQIAKDLSDYALMEGHTFVGRAWSRPRPIPGLSGYGQELSIMKGPYNPIEGSLITIATEVRYAGSVKSAQVEGPTILIRLRQPIIPSPEHQVVVWGADGSLEVISGAGVELDDPDGCAWRIRLIDVRGEVAAVAVGFHGALIGAYFFPALSALAPDEINKPDAVAQGSVMKWLHAPICSRHMNDRLRGLFTRHPAELVTGWLTGCALPPGLETAALTEAWLGAVRQRLRATSLCDRAPLFLSLLMTAAERRGMERDAEETLFYLLRLLKDTSPFLLNSIVNLLLSNAGVKKEPFRMRILQGVLGINGGTLDVAEQQLNEEASDVMRVNPAFVQRAIVDRVLAQMRDGQSLSPLDWSNLLVAMNVGAVRDVLALAVIRSTGQ